MDQSITDALRACGLDRFVPIVLAIHMTCSALDALIPQPAPGSFWLPPRKVLSLMAGNVHYAANAGQPSLISWVQRAMLILAAVVPEPVQTPPAATPAPAKPDTGSKP